MDRDEQALVALFRKSRDAAIEGSYLDAVNCVRVAEKLVAISDDHQAIMDEADDVMANYP